MWLICGLGNPDKVHKLTRHNLGFDVADRMRYLIGEIKSGSMY